MLEESDIVEAITREFEWSSNHPMIIAARHEVLVAAKLKHPSHRNLRRCQYLLPTPHAPTMRYLRTVTKLVHQNDIVERARLWKEHPFKVWKRFWAVSAASKRYRLPSFSIRV